jgi:hypothetical protein
MFPNNCLKFAGVAGRTRKELESHSALICQRRSHQAWKCKGITLNMLRLRLRRKENWGIKADAPHLLAVSADIVTTLAKHSTAIGKNNTAASPSTTL